MLITSYMDVRLRDFEETDIYKKVEWINDPQNNQFLHYDLPIQVERTIQWFKSKDNVHRLDCIIELNGIPVGIIGLLQIDKINQKAEFYITVGETGYKRKGIATKATKAILSFAFSELKLHKVYLNVDAMNIQAIRLYERVGFKKEGYFKEDLFCRQSNGFVDRIRYAYINTGNDCFLA